MSHSPRRIALTGGIACGKSLVGEALRERGIPVIDADDVVHRLLREDEALKAKIRQEFGSEVFTSEGYVDRPRLGRTIFGDVARRKLLESWIHPETRTVIERFHEENRDAPIVVSIIPLLFESGLEERYDEVWLLLTDEATQLRRLLEKRGMSREDALARIRNQMPAEEKARRTRQQASHAIWENNGEPADLLRQLDARLAAL
jgi:dephospho-CoA kinase